MATTTRVLLLLTCVAMVTLSQGQNIQWNAERRPDGSYVCWRWDWNSNAGRWFRRYKTEAPAANRLAEDMEEVLIEDATNCTALTFIKEDFMHKHQIYCMDLNDFEEKCLLGKHMMVSKGVLSLWQRQIQTQASGRKKRAMVQFGNYPDQKWSDRTIPYYFDTNPSNLHNDTEKAMIRRSMALWSEKTCVRFVEVQATTPGARLRITQSGTGCISFVGKSEVQPQPLFLPRGQCFGDNGGTIAHELGHVIGIWHEIQRPDRESHVRVNLPNVRNDESGNFLILPELVADTHGAPYDFSSIMHYDSYAFVEDRNAGQVIVTQDPGFQNSIGQRVQPSYHDIFKVNQAYCSDLCQGVSIQCIRGHQNPNNCQTCVCPDGFSGATCQQVAPSKPAAGLCGGELVAGFEPQTIQSPGYQLGQYSNNVECAWRIRANPGFKVQASFVGNFGIYQNSKETCFHWAEVKLGRDFTPAGQRFCSTTRPTVQLQSEDNEMIVIFKSVYDNTAGVSPDLRRGFQLQYQTTEPRPNPCANQPCRNNGLCTEDNTTPSGFRCTCTPQYTGTLCTEQVPCPANACSGRAERCQISPNVPNSFLCDCLSGYQGSNCETDLCENYCLNGGTCNRRSVVLVIEGQSLSQSQPCNCPPGYTGTRCENPVGCPAGAECQNGGTCIPTTDLITNPRGYRCDCMMGFLGDNCGTDICTGRCGSVGTCIRLVIDGRPTAQCNCLPGYTGQDCETEICLPGACSGNGRCIPGSPPGVSNHQDDFHCDCFSGFRITEQQTDCSDPCAVGTNPCQNGGTCIRITFGNTPSRCMCPPGYSLPNCEPRPCTSNPCLNNGMCVERPGDEGHTCICRNRYTGDNCETPPPAEPCASNPCGNNGFCTSNGVSFSCICLNSYTGNTCQTPPRNPCADNPCQNGGTCLRVTPSDTYMCFCQIGYTGRNCQTAPNPCRHNPCQNGGTCTRSGAGYLCSCTSQYQGTNCQEIVTPPGPVSDQCASRTCGGWNLTAGHHTTQVCLTGQFRMVTRVNKTCEHRWGHWPRCTYQNIQEQVPIHSCCNNALNVTARTLNGRPNVPICVMPGWENDFKPCTGRLEIHHRRYDYCGGCEKTTRSRWGLRFRAKNNCTVFERVEILRRQCASNVCQRCSGWERMCGLCSRDGCCRGTVRQGDRCIPTGGDSTPAPPREQAPTQRPIITVDPFEGLLPQREAPDSDSDSPEVSNPINRRGGGGGGGWSSWEWGHGH